MAQKQRLFKLKGMKFEIAELEMQVSGEDAERQNPVGPQRRVQPHFRARRAGAPAAVGGSSPAGRSGCGRASR